MVVWSFECLGDVGKRLWERDVMIKIVGIIRG